MAWPESLTALQQQQIQNYIDQDLRPALLNLGKALASTSLTVIPQYLSSPTGLTSSIGSPASDSVAGLLASIPGTDVVPILTSGLPLEGPILVSKIIAYSAALNSLLATNFTPAIQQDLAQFVGSVNLLGK